MTPNKQYCRIHGCYYYYSCPECAEEYIKKREAERESSEIHKQPESKNPHVNLVICPHCNKKSLYFNNTSNIYECLNTTCKRRFKKDEIPKNESSTSGGEPIKPQSPDSTNRKRIEIVQDLKKEQVSITNRGIEIKHEGKPTKGTAEVPGYVYLIIDCSSSMYGSKLQQAKKGASNFARDALTKNYLTGLIKFDSHATLVCEPCKDILLIESRVNTLEVGTTTNVEEAIYLSCNLLKGLFGMKAIVIVTDGMPNSPGDPQSSLKAGAVAKSQQIDIIAIGTDDADQDFLKELASRSELGMKVSSEKLEQSITLSVKLLPGNRMPEIKK
jgi:Mg-chelatase subunit ChlD